MKNKFEIFLDTGIFFNHISDSNTENKSILSKCKGMFEGCYTSVINASEVFSEYSDKRMRGRIKKSFEDIGILGIPFRYSEKIGKVMEAVKKKRTGNTFRDALVIAMCSETKLPFLTSKVKRYKDISKIFKVKLIDTKTIMECNSPELIFKKAKIL